MFVHQTKSTVKVGIRVVDLRNFADRGRQVLTLVLVVIVGTSVVADVAGESTTHPRVDWSKGIGGVVGGRHTKEARVRGGLEVVENRM